MRSSRWRKYSGLVLCKSRGNSGVTASTSRHWKPQESSMWRWFHIAGKCHTGHGVALPGCGGGLGLGVGLAGCRFLCAGKYIAPLTEHESSSPQHPAHGGVTFPGILFMTWWVQGVTNGWLLVFLSRMCYHKASWAVVWLMAFQGVRRKPCLLSPVGGNFWSCLSRVYFSHLFLSFGFVGRILECRSVFWLVIIFLIGN